MIKWSNQHWQAIEWVSTGILVSCTLLYNHQLVPKQWLLIIGGLALISYWLVTLPRLFGGKH
ncbi:hypothetical protein RXV91_10555 [Lactiplantibacillus sp. DA1]|uniref:hypothetical protein n=1 Tax=Lactiplantibacillus sp. DA1 TaxID=3079857 RepID=UPI00292A654C|nr:hypothetical protein [Lactiplantibacillus sp. DA1]MDV0431312.1 hypothetical protein [Lactiplantibacillus sp. DA1]